MYRPLYYCGQHGCKNQVRRMGAYCGQCSGSVKIVWIHREPTEAEAVDLMQEYAA